MPPDRGWEVGSPIVFLPLDSASDLEEPNLQLRLIVVQ